MTRLIIIDDHTMMRQLLVDELNQVTGLEVVASFATGEEALSRINQLQPDLVLMDISLPGKDGIETAAELRRRGFENPILCLTMHLNSNIMKRAFKAGVNGYALKHDAFDDLVNAIAALEAGRDYISPMLAPTGTVSDAQDAASDDEILGELSQRERQILALIAAGRRTAQIADALSISNRTVDFHRRNLNAKTGLDNIAELTKFALRTGLTSDM